MNIKQSRDKNFKSARDLPSVFPLGARKVGERELYAGSGGGAEVLYGSLVVV